MITSFAVGAEFKLIDQFSPALRKLLTEVRELNKVLDQARANLAALGKFAMPAGLTAAVAETTDLAKAWGDVAKNAAVAQRTTGQASSAAVRSAASVVGIAQPR
jgi:predicted component of type VI protein secretion system